MLPQSHAVIQPPFIIFVFSDFLFSCASVATSTAYKVKDSVKETVEKQVCVMSPLLSITCYKIL